MVLKNGSLVAVRDAEIVNVPFLAVLAGCSARRSERGVAGYTREEQRCNAPVSAVENGISAVSASLSRNFFVVLMALMSLLMVVPAKASDSQQVMQAFVQKEHVISEHVLVETKQKHQILFFMGITLLISILATAGFGIAMAVFGKQVFVPHMICAGISVFLAIAHAVTAIVWFFPFS